MLLPAPGLRGREGEREDREGDGGGDIMGAIQITVNIKRTMEIH